MSHIWQWSKKGWNWPFKAVVAFLGLVAYPKLTSLISSCCACLEPALSLLTWSHSSFCLTANYTCVFLWTWELKEVAPNKAEIHSGRGGGIKVFRGGNHRSAFLPLSFGALGIHEDTFLLHWNTNGWMVLWWGEHLPSARETQSDGLTQVSTKLRMKALVSDSPEKSRPINSHLGFLSQHWCFWRPVPMRQSVD